MSHARLSPSNKRWPYCPGSPREEAKYPDIPGEAAIDGTGSHLLLELCLENNAAAIQYDQQIIGANHPENPTGWLVDVERAKRVQMCLDYIARRVSELREQFPGAQITVESESKSDPGSAFGRDDWKGTCDVTISCRNGHTGHAYFLEVVDFKDGRGWVHVVDDTQLLSYLFGKMRPHISNGTQSFDTGRIGDCRMTIVQPKTNPVVRYQCSTNPEDNFSVESVVAKASDLAKAAAATDDPDAPLIPGKHCQWCNANPKRGGHCGAATEESIKVVKSMSNQNVNPGGENSLFEYVAKVVADPASLTSEQLSELISAKEALLAAFEKAETEATTRIETGGSVPGYEMRPGRMTRKWTDDEEAVVKKLKAKRLKQDDYYPKKLATPAQILANSNLTDVQKKKIEAEMIKEVPGKLKLTKVAHAEAATPADDPKSPENLFMGVNDTPATEQVDTPTVSFM